MALLLALLLAGCSALLLRPDDTQELAEQATAADVRIESSRLASATGCSLDYQSYRPHSDTDGGDWVVLAHGFLRSQARMRDLAVALAQAGVQVATLDFCNQRPWAGRHVQNAADMRALSRHLGAERLVYAGFSAGGLSALLAAGADPKAIGVVTLDLVDTQGLGVGAASGLGKPLLALAGAPSNCNAGANGEAVYRLARQARVQRIGAAGHCDFESPTDALCELVCADPDGAEHGPRQRIIAGTVAAVAVLFEGGSAEWPEAETATARMKSG